MEQNNEKTLLRQASSNPKNHNKAFENLKKVYEGLDIGEYSAKVFLEIIENGTANIENEFRSKSFNQLEKSGITSSLLKKNLLNVSADIMNEVKQAIKDLVASVIEFNKNVEFGKMTAKQMKVKFIGLYGNSASYGNDVDYKHLTIGKIELLTECDKTFELEPSTIKIEPSNETYFIYAKIQRSTGKGPLVVFTEPQPNTDDHFFVLWQTGNFHDIKI